MEHAGFWRRLCATVLDITFLALIACISTVIFCLATGHSIDVAKGYIGYGIDNVTLLFGYIEGFCYALFYAIFDNSVVLTHYLDELTLTLPEDPTPSLLHLAGQMLVAHLLLGVYGTLFEASHLRSTPGKRLLGLRVMRFDGKKLSVFQALGRNLLKIPASFFFCLGHVFIAFSKTKQAAYDHAAGAFIIVKPGQTSENSYPAWQ
jgi:uncharacterized RDD family membrane protein YckC